MKSSFRYIVAPILLTLGFIGSVYGARFSVEKENSNSVRVHIQFDPPEASQLSETQGGENFIPVEYQKLIILSQASQISVRQIGETLFTNNEPLIPVRDISLGASTGAQDRASLMKSSYHLKKLGEFQGRTVFQLTVHSLVEREGAAEVQCVVQTTLKCEGNSVEIVTEPAKRNRILYALSQSAQTLEKPGKMSGKPATELNLSSESLKKLKIWISEEGLYVLTHAMIEEAGFEVSGIDPRYLRILNKDREIPIRIVGGEDGSFDFIDYIEFYGEPLWDTQNTEEKRLHISSEQNIYWLEIGDRLGLRIGQQDVSLAEDATSSSRSFMFIQHFEENNKLNRLPYAENVTDVDYWFYDAGIANEEQYVLPFDLQLPDMFSTQLASIRVKLRGQSQSFQDVMVEVYLNNHYVGGAVWKGNEEILIEKDNFSPTYLQETDNQLFILNKANLDILTYVNLDWFEITYPRLYQPVEDYIRFLPAPFSSGKWNEFRIEGFTQPDISLYKVNASRLLGGKVREVIDTLGVTSYTLVFQDSIIQENAEYIAVTPDAKRLPDSLVAVDFLNLKKQGMGADYIVIVPGDTLGEEILDPLLQHRQAQGLKTFIVSLDTLYNEFNWGIPDGIAIQKFLTYAYHYWNPRPSFALLVGDGFINQRAGVDKGNLMPIRIYQTYKFGGAPVDHYYSLLDGNDDLPDIAVGRIPVRNREELTRVVDKIIAFENSPPDIWKNRYLMIGAGGGNDVFRKQSEILIRSVLPKAFSPGRLYLSGELSDPYVGGTEAFMNHLADGVSLVNYRGHGGGAIWADAGMLDLDDIEMIENSQYLPLITSMTCFTGDFASARPCLAEALLCWRDSGTIGFFGSSGVGWTVTDYTLLIEIYRLLTDPEIDTFGELIQKAKINFGMINKSVIDRSNLYQYNLIGDPALKLPFPRDPVSFDIQSKSLQPGDAVEISGQSSYNQMESHFEITESNYDDIESRSVTIDGQDWQVELPLPESLEKGSSGVRALFWNSDNHYFAHGFQPFQVGNAFFDSLSTRPAMITEKDSIGFKVFIESTEPMDYCWCEVFYPVNDSIPMVLYDGKTYHSQRKIAPKASGSRVHFAFHLLTESGVMNSSDTVSVMVQPLPNLGVQSIQFSGTEFVSLQTVLRNYNSQYNFSEDPQYADLNRLENLCVRYEMPELGWVKTDTISMPGIPEYLTEIPVFPPVQRVRVIVTVNPDSSLSESSYHDNSMSQFLQTDRFNVTPEFGSMPAEDGNGVVGLEGKILCNVPPGALSKPSALVFGDRTTSEIINGVPRIYPMYHLDFPEIREVPKLNKEMALKIYILGEDTSGITKIYHQQNLDRIPAVIPHEKHDDFFELNTRETGYFSVRNTKDTEPPEVDIQIENQPYTPGCYIAKRPTISAFIRDESGVDVRPGKILIELNGRTQDESYFSVPDSVGDQKQVVVTYQPDLNPGEHQLLIMASDIHGNVRDPQLFQFKVSGAFEIQFLGNYPNPFKRETTFVYVLTQSAIKANLKIYTVSGRLIRVFDQYELASPDYHEVVWDGTDDYGDEVANGVYFFKLEAEDYLQKRHVTGKLAKVR